MSEWISAKDRPSPSMETVWLYVDGHIVAGWNEAVQPEETPAYCTWEQGCYDLDMDHVTHWMAKPESPHG